MIYKVGLTGGIGSGKSTVANCFNELGVPIYNADQIGHELSQKHAEGYRAITETFGADILLTNGEIDRKALGDIVFNNKGLKTKLEAILHPLILHTMHQRAEAATFPYCIFDIPLLINTAEQDNVDRILVVKCAQKTRIKRIRKRSDWSNEKIKSVMADQPSEQVLIIEADDLIDNNHTIEALKPQVKKLHQQYLDLAKSHNC